MTDPILISEFERIVADAPNDGGLDSLEAAGFLELCREEAAGGAAVPISGLFAFAYALGGRPALAPAIRAIIARRSDIAIDADADLVTVIEAAGLEQSTATAAVIVTSLMAGAMQAALAMTIDYALVRRQFGRSLAQFQAIQQQVAVASEEVVAARMASEWAFGAIGTPAIGLRAAVAKFRANQAASVVASVAHAVHGAIGVSHEHDLGKLTGALREWRLAHGGIDSCAVVLGEALLNQDVRTIDFVRAL